MYESTTIEQSTADCMCEWVELVEQSKVTQSKEPSKPKASCEMLDEGENNVSVW